MGKQKSLVQAVTGTATQTANALNRSVDLPTNGYVKSILVRLAGTIVVGTANATAIIDGGWDNLLANFRLLLDGKEHVLAGVSSRMLRRQADHMEGVTGDRSTAVAVAQATYTIDILHRIWFALPNFPASGKHPSAADSVLNLRDYKTAKLLFDEMAMTAALTPDTTTTLTPALVTSIFAEEVDPDAAILGRSVKLLRTLEELDASYTGTGVKEFDLKDGNYLRSVFILARNNGAPADTVLGDLKLELKRTDGKGVSRTLFPVNVDAVANGAEVAQRTGLAHVAGYHFVNLDEDGDGKHVEDLSDCTSAKLLCTVIAAGSGVRDIRVLVERVKRIG